jgi:hypothetical protein
MLFMICAIASVVSFLFFLTNFHFSGTISITASNSLFGWGPSVESSYLLRPFLMLVILLRLIYFVLHPAHELCDGDYL